MVVLGAPLLVGGLPGPDLKQRLDMALTLRDNASLIVVTGGAPKTYGSSGEREEGVAMQEYLITHGVSPELILVEKAARNTFDNALLTRALLKKRPGGWPVPARLLVVTHDWHAERSRECFEAVFGRDVSVRIELCQVPSDKTLPAVIERIAKEKSIVVSKWVQRVAAEQRNHDGMT